MKYSGVNANAPRLIVAVIVGAIMAGIAGILIGIPVLRLRGDYLAIVTLAFGEIIKNIVNIQKNTFIIFREYEPIEKKVIEKV